MKQLITFFAFAISAFPNAFCQIDSMQIKLINEQVSSIESALLIQPNVCVDSSKKSIEPFKELYYKSKLSNELAKVDKIILIPDVKISYYFFNKLLIKVVAVDKSTNYTFNIEAYFHDDKLIYIKRKSIDGDNSGKWLVKSAKKYLERYYLINNQD